MTDEDPRQHSPAAERNQGAILAELQRLLPEHGVALEIASGTGQHAACFAAGLPGWQWQPTDPEPSALASIAAWCAGSANVLAPIALDVTSPVWPGAPLRADALFCANMLHISPWATCSALMHQSAQLLVPGGLLITYGPYFVRDEVPSLGNQSFDVDLRSRNPAWGIRWLHEVQAQAEGAGLVLEERVQMPANNLTLVFRRRR